MSVKLFNQTSSTKLKDLFKKILGYQARRNVNCIASKTDNIIAIIAVDIFNLMRKLFKARSSPIRVISSKFPSIGMNAKFCAVWKVGISQRMG